MAISPHIKNSRQGSLTIAGGSGTTYTLSMTEGDFSVSDLMAGPNDKPTQVEAIMDRGVFHDLVHTTQVFPTASFSGNWTEISDSTERTPLDIATARGAYASEVSTLGVGKPHTVNLTWQVEGTDLGDGSDHSLVMNDCFLTFSGQEGMPSNTFTISVTCYGSIVAT